MLKLFIRFLFFVAELCDRFGSWLVERQKRSGSRPCPTCTRPAFLLCEVETEEDAPARLWECEQHGCFDADGKHVGFRRTCRKCKHKEGPDNGWTCHATRAVQVPCCYDKKAKAGVCEYDEPEPGLRWNPKIPVTFERR
jgi:hypothetical protein